MRLAAGLLLALVFVSGCGSSEKEKRRDAVNDYLDRVERIQHRFEPAFRLANDAYKDFAKPKAKRELARLRGAELTILAARASLQRLAPPSDARKLHDYLVRFYDLNAALGLEVITLHQFLPGVQRLVDDLGRVNKSYRDDLSSTTTAGAQAAALDAYSAAVAKVARRFDHLAAPASLRPWQRAQLARLEQIETTGHSLASALRVGNSPAAEALIKRFRFLLAHQPNVSQAQHDAVKAYNSRLVGLAKLQGKIAAEHQRLQNLLG